MQKLINFIETVDVVRWLKFRNSVRLMTSFVDSISKLLFVQIWPVLMILLLREIYFKSFVTIETMTGAVYILYASSTLVASVAVIAFKNFDILKIFSSIIKMLASLVIIGLTLSSINSIEECFVLVLGFSAVWILTTLIRRSIDILDDLIQRSLYDFSRVLDDLSLLKERDILNLDRTDKVIKIVRQTRASKIENQDLSTEEISYHLSLVVKDHRGKSYDLKRIVYSRQYNEIALID